MRRQPVVLDFEQVCGLFISVLSSCVAPGFSCCFRWIEIDAVENFFVVFEFLIDVELDPKFFSSVSTGVYPTCRVFEVYILLLQASS